MMYPYGVLISSMFLFFRVDFLQVIRKFNCWKLSSFMWFYFHIEFYNFSLVCFPISIFLTCICIEFLCVCPDFVFYIHDIMLTVVFFREVTEKSKISGDFKMYVWRGFFICVLSWSNVLNMNFFKMHLSNLHYWWYNM